MSPTLLDDLEIKDNEMLRALAERGRLRRLAEDLAQAEWEEGLWEQPEPGELRAPLLRLAADSGRQARFAPEGALRTPDGAAVQITVDPTPEGAWILAVERRWTGSRPARACKLRIILLGQDEQSTPTLSLPEGEDFAALRMEATPGPGTTIRVLVED